MECYSSTVDLQIKWIHFNLKDEKNLSLLCSSVESSWIEPRARWSSSCFLDTPPYWGDESHTRVVLFVYYTTVKIQVKVLR
jgi:hypothetical protein